MRLSMNKKLGILAVLISVMSTNLCFAKNLTDEINSTISNSNIKKGCISISVKTIEDKKPVYELNQTVPMPPASIQKLTTTLPAIKRP